MSGRRVVTSTSHVAAILAVVGLLVFALCWLPLVGFAVSVLLVGGVALRVDGHRLLRIGLPAVATFARELGTILKGLLTYGSQLSSTNEGLSAGAIAGVIVVSTVGVLVVYALVSESARILPAEFAGTAHDFRLLAGVAVAVALSWWLWFGFDGDGNYAVWQGVGLGLTALIPGCLLVWRMRNELVALLVTPIVVGLVYGLSAMLDWARTDDTGLFMVGVMMLAPGTAMAAFFACALTRAFRGARGGTSERSEVAG